MHAEHAEELRIARGHRAQAHQRVRDREAEQVRELAQFGVRIAQHHAAAGVDVGPLRAQQQLHRLANLPAVALAHRVVRAHLDALGVVERRRLQRHVLRDVDDDRAGAASAGDVEGLLHRHRQLAHVLHEEVVLDDRARDADGVAFLEGIEPDRRRGNLPGDDHHRDGVHVGGGDAGHRIGDAGAGGDERHADVACGTGIAVRRMDGSLFMADQNVVDAVLLVQRVVDVEHRAAWVAPEVLHAFGLKTADEDFGAVGLRRLGGVRLCRSGTLDFRGRHVHFEPLSISLTKNHWCTSPRSREAGVVPARSKNGRPGRTASL